MATRANIKLIDKNDSIAWFYAHDGAPDYIFRCLNDFCHLVKIGRIRDNISQGGSWLIVLGRDLFDRQLKLSQDYSWKVGAIELATGPHGDIDYLYEIDMQRCVIKTKCISDERNIIKHVAKRHVTQK